MFLAAKRGPIEFGDDDSNGEGITARVGEDGQLWGGLVNVLAESALLLGAPWVASASSPADRRAALRNPRGINLADGLGTLQLHLLTHDPRVSRSVEETLSRDLLWSLHNSLWDRWREPTFDERTHQAWSDLLTYTRAYARTLVRLPNRPTAPATAAVPSLGRPPMNLAVYTVVMW